MVKPVSSGSPKAEELTNSEDSIHDLELYETPEERKPEDTSSKGQSGGAPTPQWRGQQQLAKPDRNAGREVDEDGHRVVLVDGEVLTVVEGDLLLDVDQK